MAFYSVLQLVVVYSSHRQGLLNLICQTLKALVSVVPGLLAVILAIAQDPQAVAQSLFEMLRL